MRITVSKTMIIIFALLVLVLGGCSPFPSRNNKCTLGNACTYYSGTEGIRMVVDRPPQALYYNSLDVSPGSNEAEFDVRLSNQGPSWSTGAVFLSGFDPNLFMIYKLQNGNWEKILVPSNQNSCYLDILGWNAGGLGFAGGCSEIGSGSYYGNSGNWIINMNLAKTFETFGAKLPDALKGVTISASGQQGGNFQLGLGLDGSVFNILLYGQALMTIMQNFDLDKWGGATFNLRGDNPDTPGGDFDYKSFKVQLWKPWPAGQDYIRVPYQIKECYAYTTFVSPMICVDPNPFSSERKVCTDEQYSWGGSQGSPVAVTSMQQTNTGREVVIDFTIKNVGSGQVWSLGYLEACSPYYPGKVTQNMYDVVNIGPAYIGDTRLDCSANEQIRLDPVTKEARFTCKYPLNLASNAGTGYLTPLKMELWYGYEQIYENSLTIRRLG